MPDSREFGNPARIRMMPLDNLKQVVQGVVLWLPILSESMVHGKVGENE
jgi:hypothetical protein